MKYAAIIALLLAVVAITTSATIHQLQSTIKMDNNDQPTICEMIGDQFNLDLQKIFPNDYYALEPFAADEGTYAVSFCKALEPVCDGNFPDTTKASICFGKAHSLGTFIAPFTEDSVQMNWVDQAEHSKGLMVSLKNGDPDCVAFGNKFVPTTQFVFTCNPSSSSSFVITELSTCFYMISIKGPEFCNL